MTMLQVRLSPSVSNAEVRKGCCNDQDDYRWKNGNYKIMPIPDGEDHVSTEFLLLKYFTPEGINCKILKN